MQTTTSNTASVSLSAAAPSVPDPTEILLTRPAGTKGFGLPASANMPLPASEFDTYVQRQQRKQETSAGDYLGSMWRQDSLVDGFTAEMVSSGMTPDPQYNPFADQEVYKGVPDEYHRYLYGATSKGQALFIRDRLQQKQEDLQRLGDMGVAGNVGRLALNLLMPDQLLMGMAGGWVAKGVQLGRMAGTAKALTGMAKVEAETAAAAQAARQASSGASVASGIAFGAGENAAFEKLRQQVNYEDSSMDVLQAGLMGAMFTAPFAVVGARQAIRIRSAAEDELALVQSLKAASQGEALTGDQVNLIRQVHARQEAIKKLDSGELTDEQLIKGMEALHGPHEPVENFLKRNEAEVRSQADSVIATQFPEAAPKPAGVGFTEAFAQLQGGGVTADIYNKAFEALKAGKSTIGGIKDPIITRARAAFDEGHITGPDDIRRFEQGGYPATKPVEALARPLDPPAESFVGQEVNWTGRTGDNTGRVLGVNEFGRLKVEDDHGVVHSVAKENLWEFRSATAPEGFLPGSIGAAQALPLGFVDINSSRFTGWHGNGALKAPARFDLYAYLNESKVNGVRALAHRLVKDPVGQKDGAAQDMTATEWKSHMKRVIAGTFHREAREAYEEALKAAEVPLWKRGEFRQDFYESATRVLRGDILALNDIDARAHAGVNKAAAALRKGYDAFLKEAQEAGVKGAQGVAPNDAYVNRIWRQDRIREAMDVHGKDTVYQLVANSMKGPLTGNLDKAKSFVDTVLRLEFSHAMQNVHLAGRDMATLRGELRAAGLAEADINNIVDTMFEVKSTASADAGQAPSLRFRFDLDETLRMQTPKGELRLADLLENDARILMDRYGESLGGHIGLAKTGIHSQAEWARAIKQLDDEVVKEPGKAGRFKVERRWLEDIHSNLMGRPMSMSENTGTARFASAFRGYTRSVMLGQLGLTAAFEMKQAIRIMGMRAFMQQLPTFSGFLRGLRQGYTPEPGLARDVMAIGGWGQEMASSYARAREIDEDFAADMLNRVERGANSVSHAMDIISGNASFTSLTKQLSAKMATQALYDQAAGLRKLGDNELARLAGQGLQGQFLQDVMDQLKQFSKVTPAGRVEGIDFQAWHAHDPEAYGKFQLYMSRQVRDSIQDHDLGETLPFMHSTLGKMFAELKTFFFVAHAKNMLKNAHYMDGTTMQVFLLGMLGEFLAYSMQAAINSPDKLDKRLDPVIMGPAVLARMSAMGFMPMIADTGYSIATGGESLLAPGVTSSGSNNRNFLITPSMMAAGRLVQVPQLAGGALLGTGTTTRREFRDTWATVPGANTYGLRGIGNWLSEGFPLNEPNAGNRQGSMR